MAATLGSAPTAAHRIVVTVVSTLASALDALAIAGQAPTGRLLGSDDPAVRGPATALTSREPAW